MFCKNFRFGLVKGVRFVDKQVLLNISKFSRKNEFVAKKVSSQKSCDFAKALNVL